MRFNSHSFIYPILLILLITICHCTSSQSNDEVFQKYAPRTVSISLDSEDLFGKKRWVGSGFLISKDGNVLTCAHVIGEQTKKLVLRVGGLGKRYFGKVIAMDLRKDIALVRLEAKENFDFFEINSNNKSKRGEAYFSISAPIGFEDSFSTGFVADPERIGVDSIDPELGFLQVNQSILPGSSGSALFGVRGNLLGMAQFQIRNSEHNQSGIGFAILPKYLNEFLSSVEDMEHPKTEILRGIVEVPVLTEFLIQKLDLPSNEGLLVSYLVEKSPAEKAGLKRYDFIIEVDGIKIKNNEQLFQRFKTVDSSERITLKIIRNRSEKTILIEP